MFYQSLILLTWFPLVSIIESRVLLPQGNSIQEEGSASTTSINNFITTPNKNSSLVTTVIDGILNQDVNVIFCADIVHSLGAAVSAFMALLTFIEKWRTTVGCDYWDHTKNSSTKDKRRCRVFVRLNSPASADLDWGLWGTRNGKKYSYLSRVERKRLRARRFGDIIDLPLLSKRLDLTIVDFDEDIEFRNYGYYNIIIENSIIENNIVENNIPDDRMTADSTVSTTSSTILECRSIEEGDVVMTMRNMMNLYKLNSDVIPKHEFWKTIGGVKNYLSKTVRPDDILESQKPEQLQPELEKVLHNFSTVWSRWLIEVEQIRRMDVAEIIEKKRVLLMTTSTSSSTAQSYSKIQSAQSIRGEMLESGRPLQYMKSLVQKVVERPEENGDLLFSVGVGSTVVSGRRGSTVVSGGRQRNEEQNEGFSIESFQTHALRDEEWTFKTGILRIYLHDYFSFDADTEFANLILHMSPAIWHKSALFVANAIEFKQVYFPTHEQMLDSKGPWYNETHAKIQNSLTHKNSDGNAMKKTSTKKGTSKEEESFYADSLEEPAKKEKNEKNDMPSQLERHGDDSPSQKSVTTPDVTVLDDTPDDTSTPILRTPIFGEYESKLAETCSYVFLRRRLFHNLGDVNWPEIPIRIPKFDGRSKRGQRDLTSKELDEIDSSLVTRDEAWKGEDKPINIKEDWEKRMKKLGIYDQLMDLEYNDRTSRTSSKKKDPRDMIFPFISRSLVSMTSCERYGRGTNAFASQECIQYVALWNYVEKITELSLKEGITCAALNLNLYTKSAFSDLNVMHQQQIQEIENWMSKIATRKAREILLLSREHTSIGEKNSFIIGDDTTTNGRNHHISIGDLHDSIGDLHDSIGDLHDSIGDLHDSIGDLHDSIGDLHDSTNSTTTMIGGNIVDLQNLHDSTNSTTTMIGGNIVDLENFRFPIHIFRKPYKALQKLDSLINIALMYLADISPLLITEVGTCWTDVLITKRLARCGYHPEIPIYKSISSTSTSESIISSTSTSESIISSTSTRISCKPVAILIANGTYIRDDIESCRMARSVSGAVRDPQALSDWNRCECAAVRGRCSPAEKLYSGFYV